MDVGDMLNTMKTNLLVLEKEKKEIESDINECYEMTKKFGHFWDSAINMLHGLLREKDEDNCQKLVDRLKGRRFQLCRKSRSLLDERKNDSVIEITSPILAKSRRYSGTRSLFE